ncbi:rhamnan synthesis F family protein [Synechococcus sp. WH 8103]|nr:rhamnan synthesis F family protein [Synechococcus sp. WH 8103]
MTQDTTKTTRLLTVMAGFFREASIPESTLIWVEALQSASDQLLLVFDNPAPRGIPTSWNTQYCQVLFGHHGEYDFGSYKRGLQRAEQLKWLESATHVLFCNDSVYGPLADLAPVIAPMLERSDEAWGLTESHQLTPHLQSFFLLLGASVLKCPGIRGVFEAVEQQPHREAVIEHYELGLSQALLRQGIELKALLPAHPQRRSLSGEPMFNPTAWPLTTIELGLPVLKKKALQDELANQEGFGEACRLLAQKNPLLWQAVLSESPHWRLWIEHLSLGILWQGDSLDVIEERLQLLRQHLHCRWTLLLPVELRHWPELQHRHSEAIDAGELLLIQPAQEADDALPALLASSADWIVRASPGLWTQPHRWALIQRQLIRQPERNVFAGDSVVVRRHWWLQRGGHQRVLKSHQHDQVWIKPRAMA